MSFQLLNQTLGWPSRKRIFQPKGEGVGRIFSFISEKLKSNLSKVDFDVGILTPESNSDNTGIVYAIVCDFKRSVSSLELNEIHRIAWNLAKSPLLIIIEPKALRAFSCLQVPEKPDSEEIKTEIKELNFIKNSPSILQDTLHGLHYIELISGNTFRKYKDHFDYKKGSEYVLLDNLKSVRKLLCDRGLGKSIVHDLLARVIFIQFLFDKKDRNGYSALNANRLKSLYQKEKILSKPYANLSEILQNYEDTYSFFKYLNHHFNGDLFPGKADTEQEREKEWQEERAQVKPEHLTLLAEFTSGDLEIKSRQLLLWKLYSFDAIPLEFISNIYEEFVNNSEEKGTATVYTPSFLVDFILDGVLPWKSKQWNIKVLDPSCGSGIFLVKVYQRLIHRWKLANRRNPEVSDLKKILENNLIGVDNHTDAVRVASFSLYLSMLEEIEPKFYWKQVKFPILRNKTIIESDFFAEGISVIQTQESLYRYDLIVGNAPWGQNTVSDTNARKWAKSHNWDIKYGDISSLFLAKAGLLLADNGLVSMIQPAGTILFDQVESAIKIRQKLFREYSIKEITNFSPVRKQLFKKAKSPACCLTFGKQQEHIIPIIYINGFTFI
ncbi:MAG: N-6 DNA methylase, partial [Spirochaetota bacterium]